MDDRFRFEHLSQKVGRLSLLLQNLQKKHDDIRACNDKIVKIGVEMKNSLGPIKDGLYIEKEKLSNNTAMRPRNFNAADETGMEIGDDDVVSGI
ncbi:hypothetical protein TWF569_008267 [Orbilia oligospora]|nr:hypothetical protein TWF103_001667 [Orbilia oligospora]KAF3088632.1 hypothetical protein TWF706_010648 [Orbilia oligospora]KAF3140519.1 hypothetical protein TWF569_008267 [Orbilia oligospora]